MIGSPLNVLDGMRKTAATQTLVRVTAVPILIDRAEADRHDECGSGQVYCGTDS